MVCLRGRAGTRGRAIWMGDIHYLGLGITADRSLGADWYEKSAKQGNAKGQVALGLVYLNGQGKPINRAEAALLLSKRRIREKRVAFTMPR